MTTSFRNVTNALGHTLHNNHTVVIFTDGACSGNPGSGGWGVAAYRNGQEVDACCGRADRTTNNKMELTAAINAVMLVNRMLPSRGKVAIITDSEYVLKGVTQWSDSWEKRGWRKADKSAVANDDLWKELLAELRRLPIGITVTWGWVRGHSGCTENQRADDLATGKVAA